MSGPTASPWRDARRRLLRDRPARISLLVLGLIGATSLAAPLLPLPSPVALDLALEPSAPVAPWAEFGRGGWSPEAYWKLSPPDQALLGLREAIFGDWQTSNWLGTDARGRDLLSRIVWGSRTSIQVALAATLCSLLFGVTYGAFSGLVGGRTDNLMMRAVDVLYSVPVIFLVIFLISALGEYRTRLAAHGIGHMTVFYLVIGGVYWLTMARVVRGQVLVLRETDFIQAARALGASRVRILIRHLLPNVLPVVVVYLTLTIPSVMLFEAFLSFLGLGVEAPMVSWGTLAVDGVEGINPIRPFWWLALWPSLAMGTTLLALGILGDGLRDALDPRMAPLLGGKHR